MGVCRKCVTPKVHANITPYFGQNVNSLINKTQVDLKPALLTKNTLKLYTIILKLHLR